MKPILFMLTITLISNIVYAQNKKDETIKNEEAAMCYTESFTYLKEGNIVVSRAMFLLNKADSLEPNNPMILSQRGLVEFSYLHDLDGAIADFTKAIELTKDSKIKETRYNNRALCYMELGDIESACKDFHRSGEEGLSYVKQYCQRSFNSKLASNPNSDLIIDLTVKNSKVSLLSTKNPLEMIPLKAIINFKNIDHPPITVTDANFDYGLEMGNSTLFLEAVNEKGKKFHFYNASNYIVVSERDDLVLKAGEQYEFEQDLMSLHLFPYPGKYKVRVALRPSVNTKGLENTYYSNWVEIEVVNE